MGKRASFDAKAVTRIMSATAKANDGKVPAGSFAAKVQGIVAKAVTPPTTSGKK